MSAGRLLVVSHPAVIAENQAVYVELLRLGWDVHLVAPARWRHDYAPGSFESLPAPGLESRFVRRRVALAGRPQRHFYLTPLRGLLRRLRPDVLFLEEEYFSVAAWQWSRAAVRAGVPFGVQADENLDRKLPVVARVIRASVLGRAAFVAARSPAASRLVGRYGATGTVGLAPHAVPGWPAPERRANGTFTVGFAGRLVPEKGIDDLVGALRRVNGAVRLLAVGDGELRGDLERLNGGLDVQVRTDVGHGAMPSAYADMDVLVLPSRTTPRWAEQFGRVLVEALWCGVPVIGSDSGEIPWVIETTRGGIVFPEGDVDRLAGTIEALRADPARRAELARNGRARVERLFAVRPAAAALDTLLRGALEQRG